VTLQRGASYYDYASQIWSDELVAEGNGTFGGALGMTPTFLAIGDADRNQVVVVPNSQTLRRDTYVPVGGLPGTSVQMTVINGSAPPNITVDHGCSHFPGGFFSTDPSECLAVEPNGTLVGAALVCFPGQPSSNDPVRHVYRCQPTVATEPCPKPTTRVGSSCCSEIAAASGPNPVCVLADHFSTLGAGSPLDSDGDGFANLLDNCPSRFNADQKDSNGNGVGDACEVAPTSVPFPPYAAAGLALALAEMVRRRNRRVAGARGHQ
jgi:hypothetical protein